MAGIVQASQHFGGLGAMKPSCGVNLNRAIEVNAVVGRARAYGAGGL